MGFLIAIEGIEGSGKTTFARRLVNELINGKRKISSLLRDNKISVTYTAEPTNGTYGKILKKVLEGKERRNSFELALLFVLDRLEHVSKLIQPELEKGNIVIVDRYIHSNLAYQGAQKSLKYEILEYLNSFFPEPNIVFLLDIPAEISLKRISPRLAPREIFDHLDFLENVRSYYRVFLHQGIFIKNGYKILDSRKDIKDLIEMALSYLETFLPLILELKKGGIKKELTDFL